MGRTNSHGYRPVAVILMVLSTLARLQDVASLAMPSIGDSSRLAAASTDYTETADGSVGRTGPTYGLKTVEGIVELNKTDPTASPPSHNPTRVSKTWPGGIVPYQIEPVFPAHMMQLIQKAMDTFHTRTCIRWVPFDGSQDHVVNIMSGEGCYSSVGKESSGMTPSQDLSLKVPGCESHSVIVHEMMHAVGFYHEQNRWDRDNYVKVYLREVKPGMEHNFQKQPRTSIPGWDQFPYEINSVMHYEGHFFAKGGGSGITMEPLQPGQDMGKAEDLTEMDVRQINHLYKCNGAGGSTEGPGVGASGGDKLPEPYELQRNLTLYMSMLDATKSSTRGTHAATLPWAAVSAVLGCLPLLTLVVSSLMVLSGSSSN